jgi:hypothetical protein
MFFFNFILNRRYETKSEKTLCFINNNFLKKIAILRIIRKYCKNNKANNKTKFLIQFYKDSTFSPKSK